MGGVWEGCVRDGGGVCEGWGWGGRGVGGVWEGCVRRVRGACEGRV